MSYRNNVPQYMALGLDAVDYHHTATRPSFCSDCGSENVLPPTPTTNQFVTLLTDTISYKKNLTNRFFTILNVCTLHTKTEWMLKVFPHRRCRGVGMQDVACINRMGSGVRGANGLKGIDVSHFSVGCREGEW